MSISRCATIVIFLFGVFSQAAYAAGTGAGGRDVYHVPMSWCALQGSPAAASPNILPLGSMTPDTNTDAILWRRHERPTDNILLPQADITLRSAINDAWGSLNFPIINDPTPGGGQQTGDVRGEASGALGAGSEFATLIQDCDDAWADLGRAGVGITAINVNLFHDAADNYGNLDTDGSWLGFPIGWGGCTRIVGSNTCRNDSTVPYDGRIVVADNQYFYPTVTDRTLPPSPNDPTGNIRYISDSLDQLVGHEVGHALGLPHPTDGDTNDLMFGTSSDNDGDGVVDNITLDATQVTTLRASSLNVPSVQIDPPQQINPGDFSGMTLVDTDEGETGLAPHVDLTSVKVLLNKKTDTVFINLRVRGVTPDGNAGRYWVTLDTDAAVNLPFGNDDRLPPFPIATDGTNAAFLIDTSSRLAKGQSWVMQNGELLVDAGKMDFQLRRLVMHPYYGSVVGQKPRLQNGEEVAIHDVITIVAPAKLLNVELDKPFILRAGARRAGDALDIIETKIGPDLKFVMEEAHLPKCFAAGPAKPGHMGRVRVEGLLQSESIHALLGPREVYRGATDADGGAEFDLPIPFDTTDGLHLVTVGVDGTALTADCVIPIDSKLVVPPGGHDADCCDKHGQMLKWILILAVVVLLLLLILLFSRRR